MQDIYYIPWVPHFARHARLTSVAASPLIYSLRFCCGTLSNLSTAFIFLQYNSNQ